MNLHSSVGIDLKIYYSHALIMVLKIWRVVRFFFQGLNTSFKQFFKTTCNTEFLDKDIEKQ